MSEEEGGGEQLFNVQRVSVYEDKSIMKMTEIWW